MFVIGRTVHEQVQIGNNIVIKVLRIGDKRVTLGIDAPKAVPLHRAEMAPPPCAVVHAHPVDSELHVLVVDNTPMHTWLVEKTFTAHGSFRVHIASDGMDALSRLGVGPIHSETPAAFDLVLLELQLPDMSGLQLLKRIRSIPGLRAMPVVVFSYDDADTEVARCLEAGANAFVPKPETQEGFRQALLRIADFWSNARRVSGCPAGFGREPLAC
jgi:two-component system response regulator